MMMPITCRMIDPGPDRKSPTCLSCGRAIIKIVRPSGATWWIHEGPTIGQKLTALNNRRKAQITGPCENGQVAS